MHRVKIWDTHVENIHSIHTRCTQLHDVQKIQNTETIVRICGSVGGWATGGGLVEVGPWGWVADGGLLGVGRGSGSPSLPLLLSQVKWVGGPRPTLDRQTNRQTEKSQTRIPKPTRP